MRLRYPDLETFIERFAPNVTRGGIFLASRAPRAEGEVFRFEVQLASGTVALAGEGKVIWVKPFDAAEPQKPHGMGVQFVQIDPDSRETLNRILQSKGTVRPAGGASSGASPGATSGATRTTGPRATLQRPGAAAGSNGRARVDTNVDSAAEYGIDEASLRRVIDWNWAVGPRADEDLEALLKPEPSEPATLAQALSELPRLLDLAPRHRSGPSRTLESPPSGGERPAAPAAGNPPSVSNGSAKASVEHPTDASDHKSFD